MYRRILVELKEDRSDRDVLPLVQELVDSGDVRKVLLVRRIGRTPVTAIDYPLRPEDVLQADREREREAKEYLDAVERTFHWRKVDHETRILFDGGSELMEELAKKEGCDIAFLPATQERGWLRWFWRRATGHVERAGAVPVALYGRPARRSKAA